MCVCMYVCICICIYIRVYIYIYIYIYTYTHLLQYKLSRRQTGSQLCFTNVSRCPCARNAFVVMPLSCRSVVVLCFRSISLLDSCHNVIIPFWCCFVKLSYDS